MHHVTGLLIVAAVVFGVNLLPAFGPPTWAVLVFYELHGGLAAVPLVLAGAAAAAVGRLLLALGFRRLRGHVSERQRTNLEAAGKLLGRDRKRSVAGLALFALSPVPSAQLFEAAGLIGLALVPLTAAFFAGRLVSYALYVGGAHAAAHTSAGQLLRSSFTSPWGIALQIALLAGLVGLTRVDWAGMQRRREDKDRAAQPPGS
jgi:membrane protein implicated in regulation of membrane protease activity